MNRLCFSVLAIAAAITPAFAEEPPRRYGPPDFVALGAGFTMDYLGADEVQPIPFGGARISTGVADLYWRGLGVRADFLAPATSGEWVGGIDGRFQFGRDDVSDPAVDALPDISNTFELGAFVGRQWSGLRNRRDSLTLAVDSLFDVGSAHEGYTLSPNISYSTPVGEDWRVNLGASAEYGSENFMATYFGITDADSMASGLAAYTADDGFYKAGTTLSATYQFSKRWGLFGLIGYQRLIGDAADSPIVSDVGSANQLIGGLSLSYRL